MFLRVYTPILLCLGLIFGSIQLTQADMYVYRDASGQRHFTNDPKRIPSRYRSQAEKMRKLEPAVKAPPPATEAPAQPAPREAPPQVVETSVPVVPPLPQVLPVDTRKFGLLQLRMTEPEILQRLGPPQYVLQGWSDYRNIWYYPGSETVPSTQLTFIAGKLTNVSRGLTQVR